jgi:hypothetical protein
VLGDNRAVTADDNRTITPAAYTAGNSKPEAAIELLPLAAIRLATELTAAAGRHLARGTERHVR